MHDGSSAESDVDPFSVLAVIVLYKMQPSESTTLRTLAAAIANDKEEHISIRILLYDNTPGGCNPAALPQGVQYYAASQNLGLAPAYNYALALAKEQGFSWLLTLDQDTHLPPNYLSRMCNLALNMRHHSRVAAIVPRLSDAGRPLSPRLPRFWGASYLEDSFTGISEREIHAFNSASLFRVGALTQIGGFNPYFWLDFLDMSIYHQLHRCGWKIYVAGDIKVEHELSLLHREKLNPARFRNMLEAESAFCDLTGSYIQGLALTSRLFCRIWRQRRRGDALALRQHTRATLKRRLLCSKAQRISEWKGVMEQQMGALPDSENARTSITRRPSVSVCMAAYNGSQFISQQIQSILPQLSSGDQLIIVDDGSTDNTSEIIKNFHDSRVRLDQHSTNLGVARSFEDALALSSGNIILFADQDDLWHPAKIQMVLEAFLSNPEITVVVSDATLIDEFGAQIAPSYYGERGRFSDGVLPNILRCKYLGCTMAFRAELLGRALPFPRSSFILHDAWVGIANKLSGGKTQFLPNPLVSYRRHDSTVTGVRRLSTFHRIKLRLHLVQAAAGLWLRYRLDANH